MNIENADEDKKQSFKTPQKKGKTPLKAANKLEDDKPNKKN